jgi:hypothetical protein
MGARNRLRRAGGRLETSGTRGEGGGKRMGGDEGGGAHIVMHSVESRYR